VAPPSAAAVGHELKSALRTLYSQNRHAAYLLDHQYARNALVRDLKGKDLFVDNPISVAIRLDIYLADSKVDWSAGDAYSSTDLPGGVGGERILFRRLEVSRTATGVNGKHSWNEEEIVPDDSLDGLEPDDEKMGEPQGNAGADIWRWYRRCVQRKAEEAAKTGSPFCLQVGAMRPHSSLCLICVYM